MLIGLALLFGVSAAPLAMGTAANMGPGFFPMMLAVVLALLGIGVTVEGIVNGSEAPARTNLRSVVLVTSSIIAFALSIESFGLVPAVALTSFLLSLADPAVRPFQALLAALILALFSWLVFTVALSMSWPAFGHLLV